MLDGIIRLHNYGSHSEVLLFEIRESLSSKYIDLSTTLYTHVGALTNGI